MRSDDGTPRAGGPEEEEALLLAGRTPVPAASAEARAAARVAFLEGRRVEIGRSAGAGGLASSEGVPAPRRRPLVVSLALAASVAALLWFGSRPADEWRVVRIVESGPATLNGQAASVGDSFASGRAASGEDCELHVQLGDRLRICLPAGSRARLPEGPGRWSGGERVLSVEEGEVFASSGARPVGFDLVVETPDARVLVTGTTFAVRRTELGTCVCLYEGDVAVRPKDGSDPVFVPRGRRVRIWSDGREPTNEPLTAEESARLSELHRAGLALGS